MKLNRSHKIVLVALLAAQNFLAAAQSNSAPPDYSTFSRFIAQRNIFDPNRLPNVPWVPRTNRTVAIAAPPPPPASFSLVGVIGYGDGSLAGTYAFFNGSDPQYHKTVKLNGSIASFKVADIAADSVTLMSGTNKLVLGVGEQLQDDGNGHWLFANGTVGRYSAAGSGYGNGRNYGRNGFNNGGGRRRNFGGGNNGGDNFNNGNNGNAGNFGRGRNNFGQSAGAADNSQGADQNDASFPMDGTFIPIPIMIAPDNSDNSAAPDDTTPPDNNP